MVYVVQAYAKSQRQTLSITAEQLLFFIADDSLTFVVCDRGFGAHDQVIGLRGHLRACAVTSSINNHVLGGYADPHGANPNKSVIPSLARSPLLEDY
jgi:hypothetical protein